MWIVRLALRRPYTFVVMALLIVIVGVFTIVEMQTDIFPSIDIPVISVIWNYGGLSPEEMERRVVNPYERALTTTVNDIEHIESQTLQGQSIIKVFFQPGASVDAAIAQITAISQSAVRQMPPGATPPFIIRYSASNVPIVQAALQSDTLSEQQLFDLGTNFIRADIATIRGAQVPWPYGGRQRQVMVDLDPQRLHAWGLSPRDVSAALGLQNVVLPTGTARMGAQEYPVVLNSSPEALDAMGALPLRTVNGTTVYLRDVANVRDGYAPQQSIVHVNGRKSVLMTVLKHGSASTLDVVARIRETLPRTLSRLPSSLRVALLFDQSVFVRAAVEGVLKEGAIAALLTALMLMLFLGSWRSTVIVIVSIPLSILVSVIALSALGQTLNVMTLGGMALAVGILVDDATVEIENVHRNLAMNKPLVQAILDGAAEIAVPAFVSTLCICIVFVPVVFISGAARSLFVPLAMAVVFAMMTSYLLSRTLVPTMMRSLLARGAHGHDTGWFARLHAAFNRGFDRLRDAYGGLLALCLARRPAVMVAFAALVLGSLGALVPRLGRDFFPSVDAGLIKLHVRCPPGTRIEETERRLAAVTATVRRLIPPNELDTLIDNIGVPTSGLNLSLSEGALISPADGQVMVSLAPHHHPTVGYVRALRSALRREHPDTTFFFLAPDISTQVLNFGLAAPINVQVLGPNGAEAETLRVARELMSRVARLPGAVDVHLFQVPAVPALRVEVDRTMASLFGLTQRDVASDLLVSLSSSSQVSPGYWLDPRRGIQYLVAVQTPPWRIGSLDALGQTPVATGGASAPQMLSNIAMLQRTSVPGNITHYDVARTYDVQANVDGADLGTVADAVAGTLAEMRPQLPRGTSFRVKGQVESMNASFRGLGFGLLFAVVLVYLLLVVNFQSWVDPLVILMALPGAVTGIAWMLFVTQTPLSVPALMGAIMCVGVATANSVLVVTFANDQRRLGRSADVAALAAGMTRLRPVIMTAVAMVLGMLPMSLGLGEGAEQNAPLGRAVIGGLVFATVTTLFFVPVMYSVLRRAPAAPLLTDEAL